MKSVREKDNLYKHNAQSTLEYAMVIACVVGAIIAMQIYVKRSVQGRLRDAADEVGEQYSAANTTSTFTQNIINPELVITNATTNWVTVNGKTYEIMEVKRHEKTNMILGDDNKEETGKLSDEKL